MSYYSYLEKLYGEMIDEELALLDRDSLADEAKLYYDREVRRRSTPEWRERQKRLETELHAQEASALKDGVSSMNKSFLQVTLIATLVLGVGIRITHLGVFLIMCGMPLLGIAVIHLAVQLSAINRNAHADPSLVRLLLFSNLFFFLSFVLQPDGGVNTPVVYPRNEALSEPFLVLSIVFFVALIISWIILTRKQSLRSDLQEGS